MTKIKFSHVLGVVLFAVCIFFEFGDVYNGTGFMVALGDVKLNIIGVPAAIWLFVAGMRMVAKTAPKRPRTSKTPARLSHGLSHAIMS
jgi:hypothetical protein